MGNYMASISRPANLILCAAFLFFVSMDIAKGKALLVDTTMQDDVPKVVTDGKGVPMVYVPKGTFKKGIQLDDAVEECKSLVPKNAISLACDKNTFVTLSSISEAEIATVSAFYIDQYEVSLGDYLDCVNVDVCETNFLKQEMEALASGDKVQMDLPVVGPNYYQAAIYCAWRGGRLPSETEWEYAARGPKSVNFPWGNAFDGTATNFCDANCLTSPDLQWNDGYSRRAPITFEKDRSWAGVYNLAGNVAEWTSTRNLDEYGNFTYSRIVRGGSFESFPLDTASWSRFSYIATENSPTIGFRCARTTQP
jgi:formylglycine-generating enzyme required for sulfatase activity